MTAASTVNKALSTLHAQLALAGWTCQSTGTEAAQAFTVSRWSQHRPFAGLAKLEAFTRQVGCVGFDQEGGAD